MTLIVAVVVGLLLIGLLAALLLRRRLLLSGLGAVTMWLRPAGASRWAVGVAWYSGDTLLWYRALSLSVRPTQRMCRAEFQIDARRSPTPADHPVPAESIVLTCRTGAGSRELAMDSSTVTGFLSWIESAPPVDH